jgi:hypothetical protein
MTHETPTIPYDDVRDLIAERRERYGRERASRVDRYLAKTVNPALAATPLSEEEASSS